MLIAWCFIYHNHTCPFSSDSVQYIHYIPNGKDHKNLYTCFCTSSPYRAQAGSCDDAPKFHVLQPEHPNPTCNTNPLWYILHSVWNFYAEHFTDFEMECLVDVYVMSTRVLRKDISIVSTKICSFWQSMEMMLSSEEYVSRKIWVKKTGVKPSKWKKPKTYKL